MYKRGLILSLQVRLGIRKGLSLFQKLLQKMKYLISQDEGRLEVKAHQRK